jgi:hypothetical protein
MKRLIACLLLAGAAVPLFAQDIPETIRLTVSANPPPVPALKIALLPEISDLKPGNALLLYYRSFSPEWWSWAQRQPADYWTKINEARSMPLNKIKAANLFIPSGALKELDRAARREYCDWEMTDRIREDGMMLLLPDLQGMRQFANFLAIRARLALADGNLEQAIYTIQTGLQMARHVGEGPTLIHTLVGVACGAIMSEQLEAVMQDPKAPNLYWALARMPRPFIDTRRSRGGEHMMIEKELAAIRDLQHGPVSQDKARQILEELMKHGPYWDNKTPDSETMKQVVALYPKSKAALLARGFAAKDVEQMPAIQVVLLHSKAEMERLRDDILKWASLPYWEGNEGLKRAEDALNSACESQQGLTLLFSLVGSIRRAHTAPMRMDRRLAALRCIEAIKLHVLDTGKLPAKLDDIKSAPVPADPMTNQAFDYRLEGQTAILTAPLNGLQRGNGWRYEIVIRK